MSDKNLCPSWLTPADFADWDAFASRHPFGLVYHLSAWKEALEKSFSHIKGNFLVLRDVGSGEIAAGIPVYTVRSWLLGNRIVSIPYASIFDPLISSNDQFRLLLLELFALQRKTGSGFIELRTLKTAPLITAPSAVATTHLRHHFLPIDRPIEELEKHLPYKSIQQVIHRAVRDGLNVEKVPAVEAIPCFHDLFAQTRKRLSLPLIPASFFMALANSFDNERLKIFFARIGEKRIAALITLSFNGTLHLEHYGAAPEAYQNGASQLLYWEAIKYARLTGCREVSFGRTDVRDSGLLAYKRRWGAVEEPIVISTIGSQAQKKGFIDSQWARRNRALQWASSHAPLSFRKLISSVIYHHHG